MGAVIDHTHSKFGKARPYVLFGSIFLVISFLLLFNVPSTLSTGGKEVYAVLTYIFMAVICYTAVNLAYSTLITLMTPDQGERAALSSVRMFFSFLAVMLINSITASLVSNFGGGQAGYSKVAMIYGAIAFVCILVSGIVGKENQAADSAADDMAEKEHIPAGEAVKALFSCKYTYICAFAFILNWMLIVLNGASTVFYARDVLGNIGLMAPLSIVGTVPSLILLILVPKIVRKWGTQKVMVIGAVIDVIAFIFPLLSPTSLVMVLIGCFLKAIGLGFVNALLFASVPEVCDYLYLTHGKHIDGLTNSIISFGMKVGTGLGSAFLGWLLAWGGYDAALAAAFQPQSAKTVLAETICFAGLPLVCGIAVVICTALLNVGTKVKELRKA
jgi:GPH family glycoside/pentoside/hexuronide:cation symporter